MSSYATFIFAAPDELSGISDCLLRENARFATLILIIASVESWLSSSLFASELANVGVPIAEQVSAAGQIFAEALVDLFGRDRDGLVLLGFEIGGPGVQRLDVVRLQVLLAGDRVAGPGGVFGDHGGERQATAGVDLVHDELDEPHV